MQLRRPNRAAKGLSWFYAMTESRSRDKAPEFVQKYIDRIVEADVLMHSTEMARYFGPRPSSWTTWKGRGRGEKKFCAIVDRCNAALRDVNRGDSAKVNEERKTRNKLMENRGRGIGSGATQTQQKKGGSRQDWTSNQKRSLGRWRKWAERWLARGRGGSDE